MATQPNDSGDQYHIISGGTSITVVSADPAAFQKIVIGGTYVGTLAVYDSATAEGTATSNLLTTIPIPATNLHRTIDYGIRCRRGITYEATGTPLMTLTWNK